MVIAIFTILVPVTLFSLCTMINDEKELDFTKKEDSLRETIRKDEMIEQSRRKLGSLRDNLKEYEMKLKILNEDLITEENIRKKEESKILPSIYDYEFTSLFYDFPIKVNKKTEIQYIYSRFF